MIAPMESVIAPTESVTVLTESVIAPMARREILARLIISREGAVRVRVGLTIKRSLSIIVITKAENEEHHHA
jgi:hypothetical protein